MNGYELHRVWFNMSFERSDIKPIHTALFLWCCELNNRLQWKDTFQLPTAYSMEVLNISNNKTYYDTLADLVKFGAIDMVSQSKNQHTANVIKICLLQNRISTVISIDISDVISTVHIDKHLNNTNPLNDLNLLNEKSEILQISSPPEKIEVEKIKKPKSKKMENTPKDYTEILKTVCEGFFEVDEEIIELWNTINNKNTWLVKDTEKRTKAATELIDYPLEFAKILIQDSIEGKADGKAWIKFVYDHTEGKFNRWLKNPNPQKRNTGGLNREIWEKEIASGIYGVATDYEKAVKYYEAVKNNLPKNVKLQMFNEKELCTLFALMQMETKAQKIKEAYREIVAAPEKYNHYGLLFEAIKEIIFK